ncbi:DUF362 domain-containing protein [Chloroflexota bacterium]
MPKSVVSIAKGTNAEKMVEEALSLLGGVSSLIKPNSTVVIKPNAIGSYSAERAITTSPEFVSAVIKVLQKAQPKEIILAESSAVKRDSIYCLEVSGILQAAKDAGVEKIIDIKKEQDLIKLPIRDHKSTTEFIRLPRFIVEADHVINLPIFKAHVAAVFSCALKNIKGLVQDSVHREMHETDLAQAAADVWSVFKFDLQIVDMISPLEGFGPLGGVRHDNFGCVVAGKDPVAVDATCCRMAGLDITQAPFFQPALDRGLGTTNEKDIEIRGKTIKEVFKQLWVPYLGGFEQWPEYNVYAHERACSSCWGLVAYSLERLKSMGEYDKNAGMSVHLGMPKELPKGVNPRDVILLGDCIPKKLRDQGIWVPGCPPGETQPAQAIMDRKVFLIGEPNPRDYFKEVDIFYDYVRKRRDEIAAGYKKAMGLGKDSN